MAADRKTNIKEETIWKEGCQDQGASKQINLCPFICNTVTWFSTMSALSPIVLSLLLRM